MSGSHLSVRKVDTLDEAEEIRLLLLRSEYKICIYVFIPEKENEPYDICISTEHNSRPDDSLLESINKFLNEKFNVEKEVESKVAETIEAVKPIKKIVN